MHVAFLTLLRTPEGAEAILRQLHRAGFKGIRCHLGVDAAEGIGALPLVEAGARALASTMGPP